MLMRIMSAINIQCTRINNNYNNDANQSIQVRKTSLPKSLYRTKAPDNLALNSHWNKLKGLLKRKCGNF